VRAEEEQRSAGAALTPTSQKDGGEDRSISLEERLKFEDTASLARLAAHLTTTGRAWDRLPPVFSNRSGAVARLELWIKARFKTLGRWFTWEQVNFNAAVHHALTETLAALSAHEQRLIEMRTEASAEAESWRTRFEKTEREIQALRGSLEALRAGIEAQAESWRARFEKTEREIQALRVGIEAQTAELRRQVTVQADNHAANLELQSANGARARETNARLAEMATETGAKLSDLTKEMTARLSELTSELRECDERLREEQRVCFKQLSLETSEVAVLEDRGRRAIESRLKKLEETREVRES